MPSAVSRQPAVTIGRRDGSPCHKNTPEVGPSPGRSRHWLQMGTKLHIP